MPKRLTIPITIPPAVILHIKKEVIAELLPKFISQYREETGKLNDKFGWQVNEGKIYILRNADIIAII